MSVLDSVLFKIRKKCYKSSAVEYVYYLTISNKAEEST